MPYNNNNGSGLLVRYNSSESLPDNYKWLIKPASGGGCLIQNKQTGYYLYAVNDSSSSASSVFMRGLYSTGTDDYRRETWRIISDDDYVELGTGVTFDDISVDIDSEVSASVNKSPASANWSSYTDFDYTIISGSEYVSYNATTRKFTGLSSGTAQIQAVHRTTGITRSFNIKVNRNAIIIIPGILGSELYAGQDYSYFKSGMPLVSTDIMDYFNDVSTLTTDFNSWKQANASYLTSTSFSLRIYAYCLYNFLECNSNGSSKYEVYTKEYVYVQPTYAADDVNRDNPIYTLPSGYDERYYTPHAGMLNTYYELIDALYSDITIANRYEIEFFSYDWRLSNAVSANKLNTFINECGYDKVVLVAHSMGGLVASGYLALGEEQQNKIDGLYYISSPLLGTPEIANVLGNTDFSTMIGWEYYSLISDAVNVVLSFVTVTYNPLRNLMCNYQSIYELMPSEYYFTLANQYYMTERNILGQATYLDYSQSYSMLANYYCNLFQATLNNQAIFFHQTLFNSVGTHISENVNTFYLYGICSETLKSLESVRTMTSCIDQETGIETFSYTYDLIENEFTYDGDSMVPKWSAALNGVPDNNRIFSCANGHSSILKDESVLSFICDNIKGIYIFDPGEQNITRGYN